MTTYIPFIPIITSLETSIEPVVQHKFHREKKWKWNLGVLFFSYNGEQNQTFSPQCFQQQQYLTTYQQLSQVFCPFQQYVDAHLYMLHHSQFGCSSAPALL